MSTIQDNLESAADRLRQAQTLVSEAAMFLRDAEDEGGENIFEFSEIDTLETTIDTFRQRIRQYYIGG